MVDCSYRRFDFIVFDWKGTLYPKGESKKSREKASWKCIIDILSSSTTFDRTYSGEQLLSYLVQLYNEEKIFAKQDECNNGKTITIEELLDRTLIRARVFDRELRQRCVMAFLKRYSLRNLNTMNEDSMIPGAEKVLQRLSSSSVPISLVRNSTKAPTEFQKSLISSGASKYFDIERNVVLSGEVGAVKPDKRIFEALIRKCNRCDLQRESPERILLVGNETAADIMGANQMGWKSVLLRTTEKTSDRLADWEIDSLEQLLSIIFDCPSNKD